MLLTFDVLHVMSVVILHMSCIKQNIIIYHYCVNFGCYAQGKYAYSFILEYWREYYLVKQIDKRFGKINIGSLD